MAVMQCRMALRYAIRMDRPSLVLMGADRTMQAKTTAASTTWPISVGLICALALLAACLCGCEGFSDFNKAIQDAMKTDENRFLGPHQPIAAPDRPRIWPIRNSATAADISEEILPNAVFPEDADYVFSEEDYIIGPNDVLDIGIMDLFQIGAETSVRRQVETSGYIDLPLLPDRIRAEGLTGQELRQVVMDSYSPDLLRDPRITVVLVSRRQQTFSVVGSVGNPGTYDTHRRDMRLMDALAVARDVRDPAIRYIYVIRQLPASPADSEGPLPPAPVDSVEPEPGPDQPSEDLPSTLPPLPGQESLESSPSPFEDDADDPLPFPLPEGDGDEEMPILPPDLPDLDTFPAPGEPAEESPETESVQPAELAQDTTIPLPDETTTLLRYVETVEVVVPTDGDVGGDETSFTIPAPADGDMVDDEHAGDDATDELDPSDPFGWGRAARTDLSRVIAINLAKLYDGDPRMNIIIRANDIIRVPQSQVGEFYVMGEVARPGVYSLTGRRLTVKQALAAAGNLGPLAWPSNSVLVRRIGESQEQTVPLNIEKIFRNEEPDIFLKANDVIEVGTHPAASFMAVIRNAFRLSYGFGFIYDRNFADPVPAGMNSDRFKRW